MAIMGHVYLPPRSQTIYRTAFIDTSLGYSVFNAFLFLVSFALYLASLCPAVSAPDTAELFLTGMNLDVGHPPGYALEALLVRLAFLIPVGGFFMRASLVSALAGAGTTTLLGSTARALGVRPAAAALGALLFAVSPFAWWQATMVEKYSIQLMLTALVVRSSIPSQARPIPAAFALGLAMLHHPFAIFLAPLALIPLLRHSSRRAVALAAFAIILVAPLRPMYATIRSAALEGSPKAINWAEPSRAGTLMDYLRLKYFNGMFSGTEAGIADHLRHYPAELSWPGLAAGFFGLVILGLARPWAGIAVAATMALTVTFAFLYSLPISAVGASHQNVFLLLALGAALALEWLILRLPRWRIILVVVTAFAIGTAVITRLPTLDGSRHLFYYDYTVAFLRLAPYGSVWRGRATMHSSAGPWKRPRTCAPTLAPSDYRAIPHRGVSSYAGATGPGPTPFFLDASSRLRTSPPQRLSSRTYWPGPGIAS